eukprot:TCONS_00032755-protein
MFTKMVTSLLVAITIVTKMVDATTSNKFMCLKDIQVNIKTSWRDGPSVGTTEYELSRPLTSTFSDWVIEIHFDQPVNQFTQWFADVDNTFKVVHEKEHVFFIKANNNRRTLSNTNLRFPIQARYSGVLVPQIKQAVLCGMTSSSAFYTTQAPLVEVLPPAFDPSPQVPSCVLSYHKAWYGGMKEILDLPVTEDTKGNWMIELKFDKPWSQVDVYGKCYAILSNGYNYICHNNEHNGDKAAGTTFIFDHQLQFSGPKTNAPKLLEAWFTGYHCVNN